MGHTLGTCPTVFFKGIVHVIFRGFIWRKLLDLGVKLPIGYECTLKFYFWKKIKKGPPYWIGPCNAFYVQKRVFRAWKPAKTSYLEMQMSVHIPSSHQSPGTTRGQIAYPDLKQKQRQRQKWRGILMHFCPL